MDAIVNQYEMRQFWSLENFKSLKLKDAWSIICENEEFNWTDSEIKSNFKHIDWNALSFNSSLPWTVDLIRKYQKWWNFSALSHIIADKNYINDEDFDTLLSRYAEKLDWKVICQGNNLSERHLNDYAKFINWRALSSNNRFIWSEEFINAHLEDIDWSVFTDCLSTPKAMNEEQNAFRKKILFLYADYLDFDLLSENNCVDFPNSFIRLYQDEFNWQKLINNPAVKWNDRLFFRYIAHIYKLPFAVIKESYMWSTIIETEANLQMTLAKL